MYRTHHITWCIRVKCVLPFWLACDILTLFHPSRNFSWPTRDQQKLQPPKNATREPDRLAHNVVANRPRPCVKGSRYLPSASSPGEVASSVSRGSFMKWLETFCRNLSPMSSETRFCILRAQKEVLSPQWTLWWHWRNRDDSCMALIREILKIVWFFNKEIYFTRTKSCLYCIMLSWSWQQTSSWLVLAKCFWFIILPCYVAQVKLTQIQENIIFWVSVFETCYLDHKNKNVLCCITFFGY